MTGPQTGGDLPPTTHTISPRPKPSESSLVSTQGKKNNVRGRPRHLYSACSAQASTPAMQANPPAWLSPQHHDCFLLTGCKETRRNPKTRPRGRQRRVKHQPSTPIRSPALNRWRGRHPGRHPPKDGPRPRIPSPSFTVQ